MGLNRCANSRACGQSVVNTLVEDSDDSADVRPSNTLPLGLPDELAGWVNNNSELVGRIQESLAGSYATLTEEQIWHVIAAAAGDPDFMKAQKDVQAAEKIWNELNHPINRSLGAIGRALDSDETDEAHNRYLQKLANFALISEGLLERRPDLAKLLNVLLVQKRMLDQSLKRAREVVKAAKELTEIFSLRDSFNKPAKRNRIRHQFKSAIERLLAPKRQFNAHVPLPWGPKV